MFWGLIMEPHKRYTQTVEKSFHVSMASLDPSTPANEMVQVKLCYDELNYLLCSLQKGGSWQVPLDLNFQEGTKIAFTTNGRVHLTGYLIPDEGLDMDDLEEEEEEEDEDQVPQLVGNQPKRKAQESPKESKKIKRLKAALKQQEESHSDDDEEDLENDDDQDDSLEIDGEVEDDSDEAEDDDDEEEEEEEDDSDEEIEVKPQQKKPKQKEQQLVNKKQEKQKLVNGQDAKPEQTKQEKKKGKGEQAQQQQQQKKAKGEQQQQQNNGQQIQKKRVIDGGVQVEDVKVGNGANAKSGKFVSVYYVGRLTNGKKFDATTHGEGFKFRLGKGEVIKGWDVGIAGMKIGGKRRITIPPGMAYGAKGSPPVIPGNSTLVFEVELKNVH